MKPITVQHLDCVPLPTNALLTIMPDYKSIQLRLEGKWASFIAAAGITGFFDTTARVACKLSHPHVSVTE